MIPIILLHAILLWQEGHSNAEPWRDVTVPVVLSGCKSVTETTLTCEKESQFDVPPIVLHRGPEDGSGVTIRTCADKSRFLLFSEDGKFHCLALTGKP
jgi:hypothetical protein